MELARHVESSILLSSIDQLGDARLRVLPVGAKRLDYRGNDQPLDISARRVVRAELGALARVQCPFEQRAEDGRLHMTPVLLRRDIEFVDAFAIEGEGRAVLEQRAIEAAQGRRRSRLEPTFVHRLPEMFERGHEGLHIVAQPFEQVSEAVLRDQLHVLSEHREQAAHQEGRHLARIVPLAVAPFQPRRNASQTFGHVARHLGRADGGIERSRIEPYGAQPLTDRLVPKVGQGNGVRSTTGELCVVAARPREVGVEFDHMADIHHDQEQRRGVV